MTSDDALMLLVRDGSEEAFAALADRHRGRLREFVYRLCWDREEAEDCAQEALVRLWLRRREYEPRTRFLTYLYTIARNCWVDRTRRRSVRPRTTSLEEQLGQAARRTIPRLIVRAEPSATAMRHILIHDPDIILCGEIRDAGEKVVAGLTTVAEARRILGPFGTRVQC